MSEVLSGTDLWGNEPRTYRLSAGVYAMRGGKAVFLERAGTVMPGFWSIPGGMVDPGEDPLTAAIRELHEESGLTPTGSVEYLGVLPLQAYGAHVLRFIYVADCDDGELTLSHEHSDGAWLAPDEYRDAHLSDAVYERWNAESPHDGFNVLANRVGLDALERYLHGNA